MPSFTDYIQEAKDLPKVTQLDHVGVKTQSLDLEGWKLPDWAYSGTGTLGTSSLNTVPGFCPRL